MGGIFAVGLAIMGLVQKRHWSDKNRVSGLIFSILVDIQLLVGVVLYFVYSNWALKAILDNGMGAVMRNSEYRFFAIEHAVFMILGFIFAHLGVALPKRVDESSRKLSRAALWLSLSLLVILAGVPWSTRPLFPAF